MDPLAAQLACDCVAGYAQRQYGRLGLFLEGRLRRPVLLAYGESLADLAAAAEGPLHLVIGKHSVVRADAEEAGLPLRPIALLTGKSGSTNQRGLFVVRADDPARTLADLAGYRILFGPAWAEEKHAAALAALEAHGVKVPGRLATSPGCNIAALAVAEREADAAVISSYAYPLLEGCGVIDKGALRVVGQTAPVPFITVFATGHLTGKAEKAVTAALLAVRGEAGLLAAMESRFGFVPPWEGWADWRGPRRDGTAARLPRRLPARPLVLWRRPLAGPALSGVAATPQVLVVADKDPEEKRDIFRCLDADTGRELWSLSYPAAGEMDYTNAPRATPVIRDGLVYLLGAFGRLHCVHLGTGGIVWQRNLPEDFGAELPQWGMCATPLVVGEKLIVNPGAGEASLVALDRRTGALLWKSPGAPAAYASPIIGTFGGVRQIVAYDSISLGGWDPETGRRLWKLVPEVEGDFNVPTPVDLGGRLLVATENNGTRIYGFDGKGRIIPRPLARNDDLAPDTSTPVAADGVVVGCSGGRLFGLDLEGGLRTLWRLEDEALSEYASLIAGSGRVLVTTAAGEVLLLRISRTPPAGPPGKVGREVPSVVSRLRPPVEGEIWSHPALVGNRLYLRSLKEVCCLLLEEEPAGSNPSSRGALAR